MQFRTIFSEIMPTWQDCSNPMQERFKEVPPFAVDISTGKIINKSSQPKLVKDDDFNIDEYIQSFKDECDIYTILEKFALTGCTDTSLINKDIMSFGDISELPDNFNDLNEYFENANKFISNYTKDTASKILDDSVSVEEIQKEINEKINLENAKAKAESEVK